MRKHKWLNIMLIVVSYILVAALAGFVTVLLRPDKPTKLDKIRTIIDEKYIGEVNGNELDDAAAAAMVDALPDRWSYYISAEQYADHMEQKKNAYVGIGITITVREDGTGFDVLQVEPSGPAQEGGVLPGDILTHVEGEPVAQLGTDGAAALIKGKEGTKVNVTFLRDGQVLDLLLERRTIQVAVATWQMLPEDIGYIKINNFNTNCADQTIQAVEELTGQGATALIFDVRNNPGGYVDELVKLLDHLLPEGPLFRSVDYRGIEDLEKSDKNCVELPMAVLMNGNSYSAAEFFAAALEEYDWAITVGDPTTGKSYYQVTYHLDDGSAVNISIGEYTTPNGRSLADEGGLRPNIPVPVEDQTAAEIYAGILEPAEDPQIRAAVDALLKTP